MSDEDTKIIDDALEQHKQEALGTLMALEQLVQRRDKTGDTLSNVISVLLRRNYYTGCSIYTLSTDCHNGPAALDLSRQMVEDVIQLEWMMVNNPDKQAAKFNTFAAVDMANFMKHATELIGVDLDERLTAEEQKKINNEDVAARKTLKMAADEERHSYNKRSFEQMVEDIRTKIDHSSLNEPSLNRILWYYLQGNAKNHTNPGELLWYLQEEDELIMNLKGCMQYALYIAHAVLFTISLRYTMKLLELSPKDHLAKTIQETLIEQHKASKN